MKDFIINPLAGGKDGKKMKKNLALIKARLDQVKEEYRFHFTERARHATKITEELIANGATDIIVVGGDGTLHEVVNGFSQFDKVALGIIPCGTGNDFASALKIPENPVAALDLILNGTPKFTDFMQMPNVRGINVIGMGIDVDVLKRYEMLKKKTKFGYTKCLIKTLFDFEYTDFSVETEKSAKGYRSFLVVVANGNRFGGGIPVCPVASATDNKLDFLTVTEMKKIKIINAFIKLKQGKVLSIKQANHEKTSFVKVTCPTPYTVNVDGELYENIPFEIKVVSNQLRVYQ